MAPSDLQNLLAQQQIAQTRELSRLNECLIGIVKDNRDPQKLGRVKVQLPTLTEAETTWWAPIVMLGAGQNRGWFFIPEVEDEVLVAFEHGDVNRPIVLGALWNGEAKPPDKNPGNNPRRLIKSREGSRVLFDDEQDRIVIEDGGGKGRITIDTAHNTILIEALEGDVALQAPEGELQIVSKETIWKAGKTIEVNIGTTLAIGTNARCDITGMRLLQFTGGPDVNINSGGQAPQAATAEPVDVPDKYGS